MLRLKVGLITILQKHTAPETFKFPLILGEDATQKDAFAAVKELIDEALGKGLKVSVFAYGSTGSGKTFTISGGPWKDNGVVQQAMAFIEFRAGLKND